MFTNAWFVPHLFQTFHSVFMDITLDLSVASQTVPYACYLHKSSRISCNHWVYFVKLFVREILRQT